MQRKKLKTISIIPVSGSPVLPGVFTTIEISDSQDISVINQIQNKEFGFLLLRPDRAKGTIKGKEDFFPVGTFATIKTKVNTIYSTVSLYVQGLSRFKVVDIKNDKGKFTATVEDFKNDKTLTAEENAALLKAYRECIEKCQDNSPKFQHIKFNAINTKDSERLGFYIASTLLPPDKQQAIIECKKPLEMTKILLEHFAYEFQVQFIHDRIEAEVTSKFAKKQKEYFIKEEIKALETELNDLSTEDIAELSDKDVASSAKRKTLIDRLKALNLTGEAYDTVFNEYYRLQSMDQSNPEYSTTKTYLETVADLPWNTFTEDTFDIEIARKILEKDHYGIKDVKDRILEFLAVKQLKQDTKGSIICLVGPPGTGKTSVGISIAKALGKKYYRFSVGGMRDEAEIKGHRRTYLASMPGQIIKGLKVTKSKNPVFVIDEVDKMTVSAHGDPASALLEVLDPEQNTAFRDHYLEIPFDISNVLFIVTANSTDTIPRPLLDRMECIELNGYTSEEKLSIGKKYLVPKSKAKHGLKSTDVKFSDTILKKIAEEYAREAGVRNFEKALDKIHRKVAMEIVQNKDIEKPVVIDDEKLIKYLGQPIFTQDEIIKASKPGMAVGLAWTSMGGDVLAIEAIKIPGKEELKLTGQLGDVMKESATIAFSYIKSISEKYNVPSTWFEKSSIHIHVPEGATPKDGPSAGITMATAMFSLITNQVIQPDLAMTGELSLLGKVMPIGGLKEKVLAAKRNQVKTIIIPAFNKRDLDKLDAKVKRGIKFFLVHDMEEVIDIAFEKEIKK